MVVILVLVVVEKADPVDLGGAGQAESGFLLAPSQIDLAEVLGVVDCFVGSGNGRKDIGHQQQQFPLKRLQQEQLRDLYDDDVRVGAAVVVVVVVGVDDGDVRPWQHRQPVQHRQQVRRLQDDDDVLVVVEDCSVAYLLKIVPDRRHRVQVLER